MTFVDLGRNDVRALGAYYTPSSAALVMAEWVVAEEGTHVLEPSVGDGSFLPAVNDVCAFREFRDVKVTGIEYTRDTLDAVVEKGLLRREHAIHSDFFAVRPFPVDAVLGNPPYVRLRHLPVAEADLALAAAEGVLGHSMETSGSVWMPFVLYATRFLRLGGRLALVLPYDFTYVRYARPLWRFLGSRFASLRLMRVQERIFQDLLQDVVLLFADGYGGTSEHVDFEAYESKTKFTAGHPDIRAEISVADITEGRRPFKEALLPAELRTLLHGRFVGITTELRKVAKFNIGYVAGDKRFFHPSPEQVETFQLPPSCLYPAATSARQIRGSGIFSSGLSVDAQSSLFLPARGPLTAEETRYVESGESQGVANRYKCRVRVPWWMVPGVKTPDLIVSVFSEEPCMLVNDAKLFASNSLLCGYLKGGVSPKRLVAGWYTPLTALQRELQIHALGGGVFVLIPGEIARVRVPKLPRAPSLADLDRAVRRGDLESAYEWGRDKVLRQLLGLTEHELTLVDEGLAVLAQWRRSASNST